MTQNDQSDTTRSISCCSGKPQNEQLIVLSGKTTFGNNAVLKGKKIKKTGTGIT